MYRGYRFQFPMQEAVTYQALKDWVAITMAGVICPSVHDNTVTLRASHVPQMLAYIIADWAQWNDMSS